MNTDAISAQSRLHQRHHVSFPATIQVHADHVEQFRLCHPMSQQDLAVVDVSKGGLGLRSGVMIPKNLRIVVTVSEAPGPEGEPVSLSIRGIVRRVSMIDHKPNFLIGVQFLDPNGEHEQALIQCVAKELGSDHKPKLVGSGHGA